MSRSNDLEQRFDARVHIYAASHERMPFPTLVGTFIGGKNERRARVADRIVHAVSDIPYYVSAPFFLLYEEISYRRVMRRKKHGKL